VRSRLLSAPALDRVHARRRGLDEAEIARQAWIVTNSLQAASGRKTQPDRHVVRETAVAPTRDELVNAAVEVGLRLESLAFRRTAANTANTANASNIAETTDTGAFWFAQKFQVGQARCALAPAGPDLYLGTSGIALFLAELGAVTEEPRFTRLARAATVTLRSQAGRGGRLLDGIGAFAGWGGIVYTLTHLGALWGDERGGL
jgi:lantibiotic modifying enzyme